MGKQIQLFGFFLICFVISACKNEMQKISDLENQIFQEYAPSPNEVGYPISYDNFRDILLKFPETSFCYDFNKLAGINYVKIIDSQDKTIRAYTGNDGSLLAIQVKSGYGIHTFNLDEDELSSLNLYSFENLNTIFSVKDDRGHIIYLLCSEDNKVAAIRIKGDELRPALVFEDDGDYISFLSSDASEDDVKIEYKQDSMKLIYPELERIDAVEYTIYAFNGRVFKKSGVIEKSPLHVSVQDYDKLIYCFLSEKVNVRIDRMKGGTFRYASWGSDKKFSEKPDLVLFSNNVKENYKTMTNSYTFNNDGYSYIMKIAKDNEDAELFVVKDGKILAHYIEYL